jgi:hypothetical protein
MLDTNTALRPEAGPVPYWMHHKRAKEALNFIIRILNGAAASVQNSKGAEGDPGVDRNRASRIVFISGEPGSGKSTLYLTLRAMLRVEARYKEGYKSDSEGHRPDLAKLEKVQWLDALDLEVAGEEGENLLAAVLVRLFRKLEESSPIHSSGCEEAIKELEDLATDIGIAWEGNLRARAGELDPDTFSTEVIRTQGARLRINKRLEEALDKLAKNKCHGCDDNTLFVLPVDDFYLKPTASLQLLRLLRMISIPRLFFLVMGDIKTVEALFIEKSLADWTEVAGTRLFAWQSNRLDEALTRARELRARYLRKLLPPLQRADIEAMDWFEALDFETRHTDNRSDKDTYHVNPNDTLEKLLDDVRLDPPHGKSGATPESLRTFLISPSLSKTDSSEWNNEKQMRQKRAKGKAGEDEKEEKEERKLKKIRSAYTALQIMDATPREIMDLAFALRDVRRKIAVEKAREEEEFKKEDRGDEDIERDPQLLLGVRNIVNLVKEEQSFLDEKAQLVLEGILPTREYSPEDINFNMSRLLLKPTERKWKRKPAEEDEKIRVLLWFRDHRSWDLGVNRKFIIDSNNKEVDLEADESLEQLDKDPYSKLPPRQAAWYVLLQDLAWKWNPDCVTGNLVETLCKKLEKFVWLHHPSETQPIQNHSNQTSTTEQEEEMRKTNLITEEEQKLNPEDDFMGWAVYSSDQGGYKHFPMPKFEIFRDLDRFLFIWSRGLDWFKKQEKADVNKLSSIWALAGWTVLTDTYEHETYKHFAKQGDEWFKAFVVTKGNFGERFGEFLRVKGIVIQPPQDKNDEITRWSGKLDELPAHFKSEKDSTQADTSGDVTKSDGGDNGGGS